MKPELRFQVPIESPGGLSTRPSFKRVAKEVVSTLGYTLWITPGQNQFACSVLFQERKPRQQFAYASERV